MIAAEWNTFSCKHSFLIEEAMFAGERVVQQVPGGRVIQRDSYAQDSCSWKTNPPNLPSRPNIANLYSYRHLIIQYRNPPTAARLPLVYSPPPTAASSSSSTLHLLPPPHHPISPSSRP